MLKPTPVVNPFMLKTIPEPEVIVAEVNNTKVPVVAAVAAKSNNTPVVVPVSIEVEVIRTREVPEPMTEVVWLTFNIVEVPATRALLINFTTSPAVVFTPVTPKRLPAPVVLDPVMLTKLPVKPVVVTDCVTKMAEPVVWEAPLTLMTKELPVVLAVAAMIIKWPVVAVDCKSSKVPLVVPVSTEVEVIRTMEVPAPSTEVV